MRRISFFEPHASPRNTAWLGRDADRLRVSITRVKKYLASPRSRVTNRLYYSNLDVIRTRAEYVSFGTVTGGRHLDDLWLLFTSSKTDN